MGLLLALLGLGMVSRPHLTRRLFTVMGLRWPEPRYERIAAWLLVVIGIVIAVLARVVS